MKFRAENSTVTPFAQTLWRLCFSFSVLFLLSAAVLVIYNFACDFRGYTSAVQKAEVLESVLAQEVLSGKADQSDDDAPVIQPQYVLTPEMPMPEVESGEYSYIGLLNIEAIALELPVISQWSYSALTVAPARYTGSAYLNNMVIAAHNYSSHFGRLKELQKGDTVTFTDMDGNIFHYLVSGTDILGPFETEAMVSGDWDLTLFTCTPGGSSRVTVRCERK